MQHGRSSVLYQHSHHHCVSTPNGPA